jgi:hypothetical protein
MFGALACICGLLQSLRPHEGQHRGVSVPDFGWGAGAGTMTAVFFALLIGFEIKHYIADYFLQPGWMLGGKGDLLKLGGYAHAGIHAALSVIVMLVCATPLWLIAVLFVAEFVVHYVLDFAKIHYSVGVHVDKEPRRFWALHGIDQLTHQLTYAAMIFAILRVRGLA